jgi:hypothetical protein
MSLESEYCSSEKTHKTKKLPSFLESFEYKYFNLLMRYWQQQLSLMLNQLQTNQFALRYRYGLPR